MGRTDHCRQLALGVQFWALAELGKGHELRRKHLLAELQDRLAVAIHDTLQDQAEDRLLPEQAPYLKAWQERQKGLADSAKKRERAAKFLTVKTGFVEKATQRVTSLTLSLIHISEPTRPY